MGELQLQDTPVTLALLGLMVLLSLMAFSNAELKRNLLLNPYLVQHRGQYYRLFGHMFIHADYMHLFLNGYVFWGFGRMLELIFTNEMLFEQMLQNEFWGVSNGRFYFGVLFLGGALFAALPAMAKHKNNPGYNALGASGGVSAVLMAYILLFPTHSLQLMFIPIDIPAFIIGIGFLVYESYMNKRGGTGIAHDAHLWGALFGIGFMILVNPSFALRFVQQVAGYFS